MKKSAPQRLEEIEELKRINSQARKAGIGILCIFSFLFVVFTILLLK